MARHADTEMTAMKKKVCTQGFLRTEGTGATGGPVRKWEVRRQREGGETWAEAFLWFPRKKGGRVSRFRTGQPE